MNPSHTILLVEDDVVDVMSVKRALQDIKAVNPLAIVGNGEEALARLRNEKHALPSIILLDLNMPRMSGLDFLKILRDDARLRRLPVVILTTSREVSDRRESFNLGVAGYMIKPIEYSEFVEVIRSIHQYWNLSEMPP